jgi:poly(3-hydroxybutyrate) depolymerase
MTHRGAPVDLSAIRRVGLLTVEGENDDISGIGQTSAAHDLCTSIISLLHLPPYSPELNPAENSAARRSAG